jgi:hypothetical protein
MNLTNAEKRARIEALHAQIVIDAGNATEYKVHTWVAEASDLGIAPGFVPAKLRTTLGNEQPFLLVASVAVHDGADRFLYRQGNGCLELVVYND